MLPNSSRYEQLTSKLVELFPQLKDGTFKVTYTDKDGDKVRVNMFSEIYFISLMQLPISNDEELSIAMTAGVNKLFVQHTKPVISEAAPVVMKDAKPEKPKKREKKQETFYVVTGETRNGVTDSYEKITVTEY